MNVQRFVASTAREALAKARLTFGDATLILSNRQTPQGVEVLAASEDSIGTSGTHLALPPATSNAPAAPTEAAPKRASFQQRAAEQQPAFDNRARHDLSALADTSASKDAEQLAMSTLSFQDYVRERMLRRRQDALRGDNTRASVPPAIATRAAAPAFAKKATRPAAPRVAPEPTPASATAALEATTAVMNELQTMRDLIEERFSAMAFLGQAKQDPIASNLMLKLIRAGYSPLLARSVVEQLPPSLTPAQAIRWVVDVLVANLKAESTDKSLHQRGGVFALLGTTGVGKTTTAAKLAALCCKAHGSHSVGLITLDTQRMGGHEQIRGYGRALGVVAHLAHDRAALQDLLGLLANKKLVLIDTMGLSPKDERLNELGDVVNLPKVNSLLVLNAGAHGDTHDATIERFPTLGDEAGVVLSKTDEAAKLGPALDALIRHQRLLRGVAHGQRVPEDWSAPDAAALVRNSMRSAGKSAQDPALSDIGLYFAQPEQHRLNLNVAGIDHD